MQTSDALAYRGQFPGKLAERRGDEEELRTVTKGPDYLGKETVQRVELKFAQIHVQQIDGYKVLAAEFLQVGVVILAGEAGA